MEEYNKIIESLSIRFIKARHTNVIQSVTVENFYDVENTIFLVHKGVLKFGKDKEEVKAGEVLFVPGGKMASITYGSGKAISLSNDDFLNNKEKYLESVKGYSLEEETRDNFSYITFEAKVFDTVNFFASLDIPPFVMKDGMMGTLIQDIVVEHFSGKLGRDRIVKLETDRLVVQAIRYIIQQNLYVEQLATNSNYFKDPRLIDIFAYIKDNLGDDLSNKILANVANVSEDYVGQYFKMLTGINPQDYIEYQRMEKAVNLLRTSKKSIREIGKDVGYKDTAYFCRRFKMMFGIPAGKMRRRESLINV